VAGVVVLSVVWTGKNPDRAQSPATTARGSRVFHLFFSPDIMLFQLSNIESDGLQQAFKCSNFKKCAFKYIENSWRTADPPFLMGLCLELENLTELLL
jgi:hypothetical protein